MNIMNMLLNKYPLQPEWNKGGVCQELLLHWCLALQKGEQPCFQGPRIIGVFIQSTVESSQPSLGKYEHYTTTTCSCLQTKLCILQRAIWLASDCVFYCLCCTHYAILYTTVFVHILCDCFLSILQCLLCKQHSVLLICVVLFDVLHVLVFWH